MTPIAAVATYGKPFLLWTNVLLKAGEMMWASSQVIMHRTQQVLLAHPNYSAGDRREIALMGEEKVQAALASGTAMNAQLIRMSFELGRFAFEQWLATVAPLTEFAPHRQSFGQQIKLIGDTAGRSAAAASRLSTSMAKLAGHGLKPIHARATANARRLTKR